MLCILTLDRAFLTFDQISEGLMTCLDLLPVRHCWQWRCRNTIYRAADCEHAEANVLNQSLVSKFFCLAQGIPASRWDPHKEDFEHIGLIVNFFVSFISISFPYNFNHSKYFLRIGELELCTSGGYVSVWLATANWFRRFLCWHSLEPGASAIETSIFGWPQGHKDSQLQATTEFGFGSIFGMGLAQLVARRFCNLEVSLEVARQDLLCILWKEMLLLLERYLLHETFCIILLFQNTFTRKDSLWHFGASARSDSSPQPEPWWLLLLLLFLLLLLLFLLFLLS